MSKRIVLSLIIILLSVIANAQTVIVSGKTIDIENKAPISGSTIQLFKTDSTYVNGAISDSIGSFILTDIKKGNYKLKISSISFCDTTLTINIHELNDINLGNISLTRDAIMLDETTVTALLPKMVVKEDTIVYNADAYQVPEGSAIEALVEQLPGTKVDDTGKITVNGKEIKKVRLDGREMMGGNSTSDMLKNLPSYIVDKIKSYDEKSDMAKLTGIDDGEETAVLDFTIKPRMRNGINAHIDAGYGTKDRYGVNSSVSRFSGKTRFTISGGANNVNNNGFSGRRGGRGGSNGGNGQRTSKNVSLQLNYDNKNNLKWNGGISWQHANTDSQTKTAAENFISRNGAFSNSRSQNNSRRDNINANFRIEWNPDTLTTISMRPSASYSTNDSHSSNLSASYNDDPYAYVSDPLNEDDIHHLAEDSLMVNYRSSKSVSYGNSKSLGTSFMVHRRLSATGRNINFNANINYSNSKNKNVSANNVHLYQIKNQWGNDSTYQTNRYTMRPSENFSYSLQVTYTEPLLKNIFLQTSYQFRYNHTKSDPSTYDFDDMEESIYKNSFNDYRDWNTFFNSLDYPIDHYLDRDLSRYAEYTNISNDLDLQLRVIREKLNMNVGFSLRPERSHMRQNYMGRAIDTIRTVTNVAPSLNMTYRFTKKSNLRLNWRGSSSQPSITDLIDIRDDSNPLAIRTGNPGLKPSFTNNINARYNGQWTNRRIMTLVGNINFRTTSNNIRDKVTYNPITGGTVSRPENINGNWSISSGITFNTTLDTLMAWNINTSTDYSFNHNVGFVSLDRQSSSVRNVTRQSTVSERIGLSYRHKRIFNIDLDGRLNYSHARNELRPQSNLDTWNFSYGGSASVNLPWNMSITTNIHQHSRRGYAASEMNTNELLWNAQISQSFLRRRALTFTLQFYDLLNQQSNFSRSINENRRSDTEYNSIHSYVMLHVIYRMDLRGNKNDRREMRERHWPSNSQDDMKPSQRNGRSGNEYRRPPGGREGFERM